MPASQKNNTMLCGAKPFRLGEILGPKEIISVLAINGNLLTFGVFVAKVAKRGINLL